MIRLNSASQLSLTGLSHVHCQTIFFVYRDGFVTTLCKKFPNKKKTLNEFISKLVSVGILDEFPDGWRKFPKFQKIPRPEFSQTWHDACPKSQSQFFAFGDYVLGPRRCWTFPVGYKRFCLGVTISKGLPPYLSWGYDFRGSYNLFALGID